MLFRRLAWWVAFGLIVVWVVFSLRRVELDLLLSSMRLLSWWQVVVLGMLQVLTMSLIAIQWQWILKAHGSQVSFLKLMRMNLVGAFFEGLTPAAKSGGEVIKYKLLRDEQLSKRTVMQVMIFQKVVSLSVFLLFLALSLLVFIPSLNLTQTLPGWPLLGIFGGLVVVLMGGYFLLLKTKESTTRRLFEEAWHRHRSIRVPLVFVSVLVWLIYPLKLLVLLRMMQASLALEGAFVLTFVSYAIAQLPLTLGGVGTFEVTFVSVMQRLTFSETFALGVALWFRFVTFWSVFLVGALVVLMTFWQTKKRFL